MGEEVLQLKTDEALLEKIKKAADIKQNAEQILEQRVSFIFGSMDKDSTITRDRIRKALLEQGGDQ